MSCFDIFTGCTEFVGGHLEATQGFEKHATTSAMYLLCTFSGHVIQYLVFFEILWRYRWYFLAWPSLCSPFPDHLVAIYSACNPDYEP